MPWCPWQRTGRNAMQYFRSTLRCKWLCSASTKTSWAVTGRARTTALNWQHADAAGPRCDCSSSSFVHGRLTAVALRKMAAWHTGKHLQYDYYLYCCGQQSLLDNYFELSHVSPDALTISKSCQPASLQWLSCCSRVRSFSLPMLVLLSPSLASNTALVSCLLMKLEWQRYTASIPVGCFWERSLRWQIKQSCAYSPTCSVMTTCNLCHVSTPQSSRACTIIKSSCSPT